MSLPNRYILLPVGLPGLGKSTTLKLIQHFNPGFVHLQYDDIKSNKKIKLIKLIGEHLVNNRNRNNNPIIMIDRNSSTISERLQIIRDLEVNYNDLYSLKFICLSYIPPDYLLKTNKENKEKLFQFCLNRIKDRGEDHQNLKIKNDEDTKKISKILSIFINRFQQIDVSKEPDSLFDLIIDLSISESDNSAVNALTVLKTMKETYGDDLPVNVPEVNEITEVLNTLKHSNDNSDKPISIKRKIIEGPLDRLLKVPKKENIKE